MMGKPDTPEEFVQGQLIQDDPVRAYFEGFPGFSYDREEPPASQFDRLAEGRGWSLGSPARKMALRELQTALFRRFDPSYEDYSAVVDINLPKLDISSEQEGHRIQPEWEEDSPRRPLEHLDAFFSKYPYFERDYTKSVATQLNELRRQEKWWGHRRNLWDIALWEYQSALVLQFNALFGVDTDDLETWHRVLARLNPGKLPKTVDECKQLVGSLHFNLVDLIEASVDSLDERRVTVFQTEEALSSYTVKTRKYFPRKHAWAGDVLQCFLRPMQ